MSEEAQAEINEYFKAVHDAVSDQPDIRDHKGRLVLARFFDEAAELTNRFAREVAEL